MDNIIEKIQKLLAMADGDDNEARSALMKARELMARNKISEKDVRPKDGPRTLNKVADPSITYSGFRDSWIGPLSNVVADYHCCGAVRQQMRGSSVGWIMFIGLDDDPSVASEIFRYAVAHIRRAEKEHRKYVNLRYKLQLYRNEEMRAWSSSYPTGFIMGLRDQYKAQFAHGEESLALALVRPAEVQQFLGTLKRNNMRTRQTRKDVDYMRNGYADGLRFKLQKLISE